jgi:hypothetical protein
MPLTAMAPYFGSDTVGMVVEVEWDSGDKIQMIVIDAKGSTDPYPRNVNASAFDASSGGNLIGHYYVEKSKLAITEMISDSSTCASFNNQFGTNLTSSSKVIKVTKTTQSYLN